MTNHVMTENNLKIYVKDKIIQSKIIDPNALVLDELGVGWGTNRLDIAIISDKLIGYELKSDQDNMKRLKNQAEAFSKVMDRMILIVGSKHIKHLSNIEDSIPKWWGITIATIGKRGSINFQTIRRPKLNKRLDRIELLKLLWKNELLELIEPFRKRSMKISSRTKVELVELINNFYTTDQIRKLVIQYLKNRTTWSQ